MVLIISHSGGQKIILNSLSNNTSNQFKVQYCLCLSSIQVYEDYGIDWNGPHSLRGGTVSVPEIQLAHELSDEEVAILPARGVSITDALRSYVETVQVLSRIID